MSEPIVVSIGPADVYAVTSLSNPNRCYQVTKFPPGDHFPTGGYRCDCIAGQFSKPCRHVNAVKARLAEPFRAKKPTRPNLVSINGGVA